MMQVFCTVIAKCTAQGSRSGPEDAGAYAGADEGAGPTPQSLHAAGEFIEAHVNRLAAPRQHMLDELDRRIPLAFSTELPIVCTYVLTVRHGRVRRQGWQASYGLVNLYKDGSDSTGAHSGELNTLLPHGVRASKGAMPGDMDCCKYN